MFNVIMLNTLATCSVKNVIVNVPLQYEVKGTQSTLIYTLLAYLTKRLLK